MRSYADVGMWSGGVIARKVGNRIEIAFGHHRIVAARRSGFTHVDVVLMSLTDEQMIGYMGRENMEDFNAEFMTMLEAWEAGVEFLKLGKVSRPQNTDVARLLGWTRPNPKKDKNYEIVNSTAEACAAAAELVAGGHIKRDVLNGLSVTTALAICCEARKNIQTLADLGKTVKRPAAEIAEAQKQVGRAVVKTVQESREGNVASRDLRGQASRPQLSLLQGALKDASTPLFAAFAAMARYHRSRAWNKTPTLCAREDRRDGRGVAPAGASKTFRPWTGWSLLLEIAIKRNQDSISKLTVKTDNVVRLRAIQAGAA